jgi:type I restriction enzyme S subunit
MGGLGNKVYLKNTKDYINSKAVIKMKLFPKGSVLFTKSGMSLLLNQRAILARDMYIVSHIGVSIPLGEILSEWIFYYLKIFDLKTLAHATTLPSLQL